MTSEDTHYPDDYRAHTHSVTRIQLTYLSTNSTSRDMADRDRPKLLAADASLSDVPPISPAGCRLLLINNTQFVYFCR